MGKGSESAINPPAGNTTCNDQRLFSWNQVKDHNKKDDLWIVINKNVYDVSNFHKRHPGGSKIMSLYGGDDATDPFHAFHTNENMVKKYMKTYYIGKIDEKNPISTESTTETTTEGTANEIAILERKEAINRDFEQLRQTAIKMGLFKPSVTFYLLQIFQVLFLQVMGFYILIKYGAGVIPVITAMICHVVATSQAGWSQHDYGHLSVFKNPSVNRFMHVLIMSYIKGVSSHWWIDRHNRHHARTNINDQDPDVRNEPFFVLGDVQPRNMAAKNAKKKKTPFDYTKQHLTFIIGAALLIPLYFQQSTFMHAWSRKKFFELITMVQMYIIHFFITIPIFGVFGALSYFFVMRVLESCWFTWVTQINHIAMDVHDEADEDTWVTLHLKGTCNIEKSWFNDWFTGHLNFQIEHHLFPSMPRHNLYKIQPLVQSLCKKHNIQYVNKPLWTAFVDIVTSLEKSGQIWRETYEELIA